MFTSRKSTPADAWRTHDKTRLRILLAEDDQATRELVAADLRQDGSEVVAVPDGHEALECFRQSAEAGPSQWFDVIVSDLKMPRLNGMRLLAALREDGSFTPFILVSAFLEPAMQIEARRLGAWSVLKKPLDLEALYLAVHRTI